MLVAHGKHAHELRLRNDLVDSPGKGCENGGYATMNLFTLRQVGPPLLHCKLH